MKVFKNQIEQLMLPVGRSMMVGTLMSAPGSRAGNAQAREAGKAYFDAYRAAAERALRIVRAAKAAEVTR